MVSYFPFYRDALNRGSPPHPPPPNPQSPQRRKPAPAAMALNIASIRDTKWLTLEVCRQFQRGTCSRSDEECKFAHPPKSCQVENGRVIACFDSLKVRCNTPVRFILLCLVFYLYCIYTVYVHKCSWGSFKIFYTFRYIGFYVFPGRLLFPPWRKKNFRSPKFDVAVP